MPGIFPSDAIIKQSIELGMQEIRSNTWLLNHIFRDFVGNPYLAQKYGQKHIDAAKEWFLNNQIDVYLTPRRDHSNLPAISIYLNASNEKQDMKTMADQSTEVLTLMPGEIGKPIAYIVKPFTITSYDSSTGEVVIDQTTPNIQAVTPGMILVDPSTGNGYVISSITPDGVEIQDDLTLSTNVFGIVPQFQFYKARIEHTFFQETYTIGCHAHGDPSTLLWLHSIVLYSLLRYRETLLEASGFAESVISSGDLEPNEYFTGPGGEDAFSRYISITGQVENSWVKTPRRIIETVSIQQDTSSGIIGGIQILSNLDTTEDKTKVTWYTTQDSDD